MKKPRRRRPGPAKARRPIKSVRRASIPFSDPRITHPKKRAFLAAFGESGNVSDASAAAGINRRTHSAWLKDDADYADAFANGATQHAGDTLVAEATRRAVVGVDKPVFYKGRKIATLKEYSDTLLIFLIKGARPDVYRERFEHTGRDGAPISQTFTLQLAGRDDAGR